MSIELKPLGDRCNLRCEYCYEVGTRTRTCPITYDHERTMELVQHFQMDFFLFGGEALLLPLPQLDDLFRLGFEKFKHVGIQTNGTLITDAHVAMFKKYKVGVGISIDGPGELNDVRWAGTLEGTRKLTARTEDAIRRCCAAGLRPSLIVTIHQGNVGTDERLDRWIQWCRELSTLGIQHINVHFMEPNGQATHLELSDERTLQVVARLWDLVEEPPVLRQQMHDSVLRALRGENSQVLCTYRPCDVLNTPSCRGCEADGKPSNCGRVYRKGTVWMPTEAHGWERAIMLYQTPQEDGGCQGCAFWLSCFGYCPSSGIDDDWRNRSVHCPVVKSMFQEGEQRLLAAGIVPVSRLPRRQAIEQQMVAALQRGERINVQQILEGKPCAPQQSAGGTHLDHLDKAGIQPHSDTSHRDHTDRS
ncbi:radical SAM protein [archaeon]|nr:MAG: radical SAM protein [archaeon]